MKLYTEEQVKHAIQMARASQNLFTTPFIYDKHEILEQLTPIELPSDEEILVPFPTTDDYDFRDGKEVGCWMNGWEQGFKEARKNILNKTYGGNK